MVFIVFNKRSNHEHSLYFLNETKEKNSLIYLQFPKEKQAL